MYEYEIVDAFTSIALQGNPVAVFFKAQSLSIQRMQQIAAEMHLSETTFITSETINSNIPIKIFTPVNELEYAGHPVLGTAAAIFYVSGLRSFKITTARGAIECNVESTGKESVRVRMTQPVPTWEVYYGDLLSSLGISESILPIEIYDNGPRHAIVTLSSVKQLASLNPDYRALSEHQNMAINCIAEGKNGWRNRMFSPSYGVVEDAATGSAAGPILIHLCRHRKVNRGRRIQITQGVEMGRISNMFVDIEWDEAKPQKIIISGDAIRVIHGQLQL